MSDSGQAAGHTPGRTPRRAPKRQEWLPNRMFDPANNPFAIQNLLQRQRQEEKLSFVSASDERPAGDYTGNSVLHNKDILPPGSFASNALLDAELPRTRSFEAEYEEDYADEEQAAAVSSIRPERDAHDIDAHGSDTADAADLAARDNAPGAASQPLANNPAGVHMRADSAPDLSSESPAMSKEHADAVADQDVSGAEPAAETELEVAAAQIAADITDNPLSAEATAADELVEQTSTEVASADEIDVAAAAPVQPEPEVSSAESPVAEKGDASAQSSSDIEPEPVAIAAMDADAEPAAEPASEPSLEPSAPAESDLSGEAVNRLLDAVREEAREQGRQEARESAYQEGLEAGIAQTRAELEQSVDDKLAIMNQLIHSLQQLGQDPDALFEPLKKLAVHLAEQLVRGELAQSSQSISRLVDNCLRELAASGEKAVIIHLHPEDLELYKPTIAQFGDGLMLRPDALLSRGSVRASLDGSVVEDLIERRVQGLKKSLAQPVVQGWRPAVPNPLIQRPQPETAKPLKVAAEAATATTNSELMPDFDNSVAQADTADTADAAEASDASDTPDISDAPDSPDASDTEASATTAGITDTADTAEVSSDGRGPLS